MKFQVFYIQSQNSDHTTPDSPLIFYAALFIIFGALSALSFVRPIMNLYTIYFEISWAEFQVLELFDILNLLFGILLILLGILIVIFKKINRSLLIFGGILFLIFNFLDPSQFLMLGLLFSIIIGIPPLWIQVTSEELLVTYISVWSAISISSIILTCIGIYISFRIILNKRPQTGMVTYLFFYCWILVLSGIMMTFQSILAPSLTGSWSSIAIAPYLLNLCSWGAMVLTGITGLLFIGAWRKNQLSTRQTKLGQLALISYSLMYLLISFTDLTMKDVTSIIFSILFSMVIIIFAFKIPVFLKNALPLKN